MSAAARWKPSAERIASGSLNFWKPISESTSWRKVERSAA
jgi:hypothetical protein